MTNTQHTMVKNITWTPATWAIASTYYSGDDESQALGPARYATKDEAYDAADRLSHQHPNAEFDVVQVKDGGAE
jgi:hypothetical protein